MTSNKTVLKIISLVIAILLWVYVMGEVNPETKVKVYDINVNYINTDVLADSGLAVAEDKPVRISAVIDGKRSDVNKAKKKGLTASIDVSRCKEGNNKVDISLNLPAGVNLDSVSEDETDIKVEKIVWAEKPVDIEFSEEPEYDEDTEELIPWITGQDPGKVTVYGAGSLVEKVEKLTGKVSEKTASRKGSKTIVNLAAVDKDGNTVGGVSLNMKKAVVSAQLLRIAEVPVDVECTGLDSGYSVKDVHCDKVSIVASDDAVKFLETISGTADLSNIEKEGTYTTKIDINTLPKGIYLFNDSNIKGNITVEETE